MSITLSRCSRPSIRLCAPAASRDLNSRCDNAGNNVLVISDDLPEPETPVMITIRPRGSSAVMSFRLFSRAPTMRTHLPLPVRRSPGMATVRWPLRNCPVNDSGRAMMSSIVPSATTRPPCSPAPGPMSTIQSAARIVSSSCSTTMSVFPRSRSRSSVRIRRALSRWCRPILGSSRMYSTPVSPEPIWVASRIRCASPPDSVAAVRLTVR